MDRIKKFSVTSIEMEGFKKHKEPYKTDFDVISYIFGGNGQGKTTIADAISYAFCGTPFWGEKSADRLQNPQCSKMRVAVKFTDEKGDMHTLERTRAESATTIVLDGTQMRQADITTIFAERDIFLSLFNPLYFIEKIADSGREFLQKLLPPIKREEVLEHLSENVKSVLENEDFSEPESYIKTKRDKLREKEEEVTRIKAQIDLLKDQKKAASKNIDDIIKMGEEFVAKKKTLEEKRYKGIDVEALKKEQESIIRNSSDERRKNLLAKQAEIENRQYVSKYLDEASKITAELKMLKEKFETIKVRMSELKVGDVCPYCGTKATDENLEHIRENMKKEAASIAAKGKDAQAAFADLKKLNEESFAKFKEFKAADLKKVSDELASLDNGDMTDAAMLEDKIRLGNLTEEEYEELLMVQKNAADYEQHVAILSEIDKNDEKIAVLEKELSKIETEMSEIKTLVDAASMYAAKKAEIMLSHLKMNHASIKLFDVVKTTGEVKDVFKFTYDGKDYRWLSASEKVKAGLEVSKLLKSLTNLNFPTYIDNAEGITTKLEPIAGQVLLAYAKNCPLTVQMPRKTEIREAA